MNYEMIDCIDAGTPYCPCHLAESNECILCSQLQGKHFCDCKNWKGTCIYQELIWNGNKAQTERQDFEGLVVKKRELVSNLVEFVIKVDHNLCKELSGVGSYVFLRTTDSLPYFDAPMSVVEADIYADTITIVIEIEGVKTKKLNELKVGDPIVVKGPFWNGVLGLKRLRKCQGNNVLIIARGIGQAPSVPVLKELQRNNNNITLIVDRGRHDILYIEKYLDKYSCNLIEMEVLYKGNLTHTLSTFLCGGIESNTIDHVHISGPDILIQKTLQKIDCRVTTSCCNNAKMCCGQGVCGACTTRFEGHVVKRLCKLQTDPEYIFEGRRLI